MRGASSGGWKKKQLTGIVTSGVINVFEDTLLKERERTGWRGRRCKQLLDDCKDTAKVLSVKAEALDSALWGSRFWRGYGPVVRQTVWRWWLKNGGRQVFIWISRLTQMFWTVKLEHYLGIIPRVSRFIISISEMTLSHEHWWSWRSLRNRGVNVSATPSWTVRLPVLFVI
jgi:hypothetical protein